MGIGWSLKTALILFFLYRVQALLKLSGLSALPSPLSGAAMQGL